MPSITLDKTAIAKLMDNPTLAPWREKTPDCKLPYFYYFQRSYTTSEKVTNVEHGDGFLLSSVERTSVILSKGIVLRSVLIANGLDLLVAAPEALMCDSFTIGWSDWKFTYQPQVTS